MCVCVFARALSLGQAGGRSSLSAMRREGEGESRGRERERERGRGRKCAEKGWEARGARAGLPALDESGLPVGDAGQELLRMQAAQGREALVEGHVLPPLRSRGPDAREERGFACVCLWGGTTRCVIESWALEESV